MTLLVFGAAAVGTVAVIGRNYRLLTDTDQRRRIHWVICGSLVALVPQFWWVGVAACAALAGPAPVPEFSLVVCAATVVIPISVAYAVVKHRVLDIKVTVRLGLQYLLGRQALQVLVALPAVGLVYADSSPRPNHSSTRYWKYRLSVLDSGGRREPEIQKTAPLVA